MCVRSVCFFSGLTPRAPERDVSAPPVSKVKPLVAVSNTRLLLGGATAVGEVWAGSTFILEGGDLPPLQVGRLATVSFGRAVQGPRSAPGREVETSVRGLVALPRCPHP